MKFPHANIIHILTILASGFWSLKRINQFEKKVFSEKKELWKIILPFSITFIECKTFVPKSQVVSCSECLNGGLENSRRLLRTSTSSSDKDAFTVNVKGTPWWRRSLTGGIYLSIEGLKKNSLPYYTTK